MNNIKIQILEYSYWEHFKALKDASFILPLEHPQRKLLELETNKIQLQLQELKKQ